MPVITKLSFQQRDPSRVNIFIDGKYTFSLSAELVITKGLKKSQILSADELQNLTKESSDGKIFAKIINYLSYRPRSTKEVSDRLIKYLGKDNQTQIPPLITRLTELGYLDDLKFATWFVESRRSHRPRSRRQLTFELLKKGIARPIIDQVLGPLTDDNLAIRQLIAKKPNLDRQHLIAYLARKGFSYSLIKEELARGPVLSESEMVSIVEPSEDM